MTVTYLSRSDWGGGPLRSGHVVPQTQFNGLVAHHTVIVMPDYDGDGFLDGDLDDICRYMRQLQHARPDLGDEVPYSFVHFFGVTRDDTVVAEGRGFGVTGAHTIGYNSSRYGCAFAGNSIDQTVTDGVMSGYRYIGRQLDNPYHAAATIGHRDVYATACPGTSLYLRLSEIQPPFDEPATPVPTPAPTEDPEMLVIQHGGTDYLLAGGKLCPLTDKMPPSVPRYAATDDRAWKFFTDTYGVPVS